MAQAGDQHVHPHLAFQGCQGLSNGMPDQTGATGLLLFALNVVPEAEDDFNARCDDEHILALTAVPGAWQLDVTDPKVADIIMS